MADIVILGAGLTGLSTAYHLEQQGYYDYQLFEKEDQTGGLCRSVKSEGFIFDYTGHLLHINNDYFKKLIEMHIGFDNLNQINRRSFIYSHDVYTRYPYQINLFGLPSSVSAECIKTFAEKPKTRKKPKSFYEWVLYNFGKGLGKHFFFPYQKKIFRYNLKELSTSWMGRFVPKTSLEDMVKGTLTDRSKESFGYNSQFYYPKQGGISSWVEQLSRTLTNSIYTNSCVSRIDTQNKKVIFKNGNSVSYKILINTIPLDYFLSILKNQSTQNFKNAVPKLLCTQVVNFNLGINRSDLSEKHWIYYPEKKYPFYRIGFPHNFASSMAPEGCSSLYGEFSLLNKNSYHKKVLLNQALDNTYKLFKISKQEIITRNILTINHAYIIYNNWRDKNVPIILKNLEELDIYSVGRYGQWKYSSMQEAVLDGKVTADSIAKRLSHEL